MNGRRKYERTKKKTFYFSPWFIKFGSIGRERNNKNGTLWNGQWMKVTHVQSFVSSLTRLIRGSSVSLCVIFFSFASFRWWSTNWWPSILLGNIGSRSTHGNTSANITTGQYYTPITCEKCKHTVGRIGPLVQRFIFIFSFFYFYFVNRTRAHFFSYIYIYGLSMLCSQC